MITDTIRLLRTLVVASVLAFLPLSAYAVSPGDIVGVNGACDDPVTLETVVTAATELERSYILQEAIKAGQCNVWPFNVSVELEEKIKTIVIDGEYYEIWKGTTTVVDFPIYVIGKAEGQGA